MRASSLPASSPTAAIVATTLRPTTSSSSISRARDAASQRPSNANSAADRQSNRSSDTPRPSTAWAEITSPETHGDAANAVLAAAGYNFRRLLECALALLLSAILAALNSAATHDSSLKPA